MANQSKFDYIDGQPDEEQIISWSEEFFFNILSMLNSFYSQNGYKDAGERLKSVSFDKLVNDQLENENDEVKTIAIRRVKELAEIEIDFLSSYSS